MIKFTNTIFNNEGFMKTLEKINSSSELPAKVAYQFFRMSKALDERNQAFQSVRLKLLEKYGTKDETTGNFQVEGESLDTFKTEFDDLITEEFELEFSKIKYVESLNLSPIEMFAVENIFDYSELEQ